MPQSKTNLGKTILTHIAYFKERKLQVRWLLAISSLPLFAIYTAFGTAPQTITQNIAVTTVVDEITLPAAQPPLVSGNSDETYWQADKVRRDDTFASLIKRLNIQNEEAISFLRQNKKAKALSSRLKPGNFIQAQTNQEGELIHLRYQIDQGQTLTIDRTPSGYEAQTAAAALENRTELKSVDINGNLFFIPKSAGIPESVSRQVTEIFSDVVDFKDASHKGDHIAVAYESSYSNGELVDAGQVLAAEITTHGQTYRAVMYRNDEGKVSYYTPEGRNLKKSFQREPLEYSHVSSGFSSGRFHPILQEVRAHTGVDFAAPTGTVVKAPGDGTVDFVGYKSGYGNVIVLQHPKNISTVYGHLSGFADGLRKGEKIIQGEIIGFVGSTGLSTGSHLHYEYRINDIPVDPLTVTLMTADPIPVKHMAAFVAQSNSLTAQLNLLGNTTRLASLD